MRLLCLLALFSATLALAQEQPVMDDLPIAPGVKITLDSSLSPAERDMARSNWTAINNFQFQGISPNGAFSRVFGGTDSAAVIKYLDERIAVLVSSQLDLDKTLVDAAGIPESLLGPVVSEAGADEVSRPTAAAGLDYTATNIGFSAWILAKLNKLKAPYFSTKNMKYKVSSTRVGIVKLDAGFVSSNQDMSAAGLDVKGAVTMIHEARHSDCTGGLKQSVIDTFLSTKSELAGFAQLRAESPTCGYIHLPCPAGHDLEGMYACEGQPWGPYSVEAVYALAIAQLCPSCNEDQKQVGYAAYADGISRIAFGQAVITSEVTHKAEWNEEGAIRELRAMFSGTYTPNMTSSSKIIQDHLTQ